MQCRIFCSNFYHSFKEGNQLLRVDLTKSNCYKVFITLSPPPAGSLLSTFTTCSAI